MAATTSNSSSSCALVIADRIMEDGGGSKWKSSFSEEQPSQQQQQQQLDKVSSGSMATNPGEISTGAGCLPVVVDDLTMNNCSLMDSNGGGGGGGDGCGGGDSTDSPDPLPKKLQQTVNTRLKNDLVVSCFLAVVILSLHCSTVFTVLQPDLNIILYGFTGSLGFLLHYIIPQLRKHMPWLCFAQPILRQQEYGRFEVYDPPKVMWFEKFYIYMSLLERNILFPLLVISAVTADSITIANKYGNGWGAFIITVCALKCKYFFNIFLIAILIMIL